MRRFFRKPDNVIWLAFAVMILCVILGTGKAHAQPTSFCGSIQQAEEALNGLGEAAVYGYATENQDGSYTMRVMYANPSTGEWTLMIVSPDSASMCTATHGIGLVITKYGLMLPQLEEPREGI